MRIRLKGINSITKRLADGSKRTYWYAWKGGPPLSGEPGSAEFVASYNEAVARKPAQRLGVLFALLHPAVSAFPERVVGSACALSFSRIAQRSLALRPAHSRCHQFVTR